MRAAHLKVRRSTPHGRLLLEPGSHVAGVGGQQRRADQALSAADQVASAGDQAASDADQAASAAGREASHLEQRRADLEQQASDADQAAADQDARNGSPQTSEQLAAANQSRALRVGATADRLSAASGRAVADDSRDRQDAEREQVSADRDSSSADRDLVADHRDEASDRIEQSMWVTPPAASQLGRDATRRRTAAGARAQAAEERRSAASQRARELVQEAQVAIDEERLADAALNDALAAELASSDRAACLRATVPGAASRGEFSLHYQPLYRLDPGEIVGFEALLRWTSPDLGAVPPDEFIPIAEETGVIVPIGDWVLETGLRTLAIWRTNQPGRNLTLAVNVAPEQLVAPAFSEQVAELLEETGVPPAALTLELTERTLVNDKPTLRAAMVRLRGIGIRLSVDDFGTGFSSLGRLSSFPVDELKIDRIFVAGIADDRRQRALVAGIVGMSAALDLRVVAEGIETMEQHQILIELGCDLGQGFLMSRPLDHEAFTRLIDVAGSDAEADDAAVTTSVEVLSI